MKLTKHIIFIVFIPLLWACNKSECPDCLKSTGEIITEERILSEFNKVIVYSRINLNLIQDTVNKIIIEAGENLLPKIITEINDGFLTIRDDNKCNWVRSYKNEINITLYCKTLNLIDCRTTGYVRGLNTFQVDTFDVNAWDGNPEIKFDIIAKSTYVRMHTGPGSVELSGTSGQAYYYSRAYGPINCKNLITPYAFIDIRCVSDAYIYSNSLIEGEIGYIGNVYYAGNPQILEVNMWHDGKLLPID